VAEVPHEYNPYWVYIRNTDGAIVLFSGDNEPIHRRQELPQAYHRDGSIYLTKVKALFEHGNLYGASTMPFQSTVDTVVNLDTEEDWEFVQERIRPKG
jgi:CMP-N-acetylneuraminic acid synthetase